MQQNQDSSSSDRKKSIQGKRIIKSEFHPDHSKHLMRLKKVKGQIEGLERMIQEKRYCPDIITQIKAATAALRAIEAEVFKTHLRGCVRSAFNSGDTFDSETKVDEIVKMVY